MNKSREFSIKNSALWAAYGDALGFITELVDERGVFRRINTNRVQKTVSWRYMAGGRFGAEVELPAGCYSDDTQLRLATSRAIKRDGTFDVEAFAKIELTIWPTYSLGGGRGTKQAASNLSSQDVNWFTNFFNQRRGNYIKCGGNGGAMRIQPHIWAAQQKDKSKWDSFLLDVVKNTICTHGHPRGILGAVFHALSLYSALKNGSVPSPDLWFEFVHFFSEIAVLIKNDKDMGTFWLPTWENRAGIKLEAAFEEVKQECLNDISIIVENFKSKSERSYQNCVKQIGGINSSTRGSGTKTALIATALSWMYGDERPDIPLTIAANCLQSDTDTIATMSGAILGAVNPEMPSEKIMDREYIEREAIRLAQIGEGKIAEVFNYPDLMLWQPPKTQLDVVGVNQDHFLIKGLSYAHKVGNEVESQGKGDAVWQWLKVAFGQSLLCKRRSTLPQFSKSEISHGFIFPKNIPEKKAQTEKRNGEGYKQQSLLPDISATDRKSERVNDVDRSKNNKTIDEMTNLAINSNFDSALIGNHLKSFAKDADGIERSIAYSSIIVKALMARLRKEREQR
ncbi:ADP-ribosylation/Crystallin J1 [Desulfatibacillum aliphaticivorans]|uniref:ADP-ribosylation/Crystallin J1 n=1 Tax=Desulfatibacillum aliphaticivorans TaxID=218208 RepID=B8FA53_DESAL|nr:ADP-ribosylglycohydrolase family protein [Desulfatibacillum aliphaticivorans]ACL03149.1 ADP-ribosylation/Crystallin J1 [Desulfatibacillum aliphaticivorans]